MSSLTRMLSILDLFSSTAMSLTAESIAESMGFTRTTCYRYVKELTEAGLLSNANSLYSLGARIINLDHKMRESDPLLRAGIPELTKLVKSTGGEGLISTMYDEQIINIHHESGAQQLSLTFSRGQVMPLMKGASSKVIISTMSRARLKRLFDRHLLAGDPALTDDWPTLWRYCQTIIHQGYWVSREELDEGHVGISSPIPAGENGEANSSVTLVFTREHFSLFNESALGAAISSAAKLIGHRAYPYSPPPSDH